MILNVSFKAIYMKILIPEKNYLHSFFNIYFFNGRKNETIVEN